MGCGCGKRFTKPSEIVPTPESILEEIARRVERDVKTAGIGSRNGAGDSSREA